MWPFKRKADPLPPEPIPELVPTDSAVERRIRVAINERPGLVAHLIETQPDTLLIYLEEVGTAAIALTFPEENRMTVQVHTWLRHDRYRKRQRGDAPMHEDELRRGVTIKLTLPTAPIEQVVGTVVLYGDDGNVYGANPLQTMDELDSVEGRRNARLDS